MARTERNIYYPDDYNEVADIPADLQTMAESIDDAIDGAVQEATYDDTALKARVTINEGDIADIKSEQTTQNTNIQTNANAISSLQGTVTAQGQSIENLSNNKVDKVQGKGLSTEDFTTAEKTKLAGIEAEANKTIVDNALSNSSENPVQNKVIYASQEEQNNKIQLLETDVEDLRNNSLQVSGSGSNFQLSPTAKARFIDIKVKGNTWQNTSELFYICDGTETGTYYFTYDSINYQFTMPTITSGDILVFNTDTLALKLNDTEITTETGTSGTELIFTASPNPDYPQTIHNVTGNVNVKIQNKNLFTLDNYFYNAGTVTTSGNNKEFTLSGANTTKFNLYKLGLLKDFKGQTLTFNCDYSTTGNISTANIGLVSCNSNGESRHTLLNFTKGTKTITGTYTVPDTVDETKTLALRLYATGSTANASTTYKNTQIELNSIATSYVLHQEQNLPLTLGDLELNKIPDTDIQDSVYKRNGKWYLHKEVMKKILDGTESGWSKARNYNR